MMMMMMMKLKTTPVKTTKGLTSNSEHKSHCRDHRAAHTAQRGADVAHDETECSPQESEDCRQAWTSFVIDPFEAWKIGGLVSEKHEIKGDNVEPEESGLDEEEHEKLVDAGFVVGVLG